MYTALQLVKDEIKNARETFEGTAGDIQPEHLHKDPGGTALTLGATYAHLIFSEDGIVHGMLQGKAPLYQTTWKDKTGASAPMPEMDEKWAEAHATWGKTVQIDLDTMKTYAQAVFSATDAYVNGLTDEDLLVVKDLGMMGKRTVLHILSEYIVGHMNSLTGEMSALKGIQGAKGYPF